MWGVMVNSDLETPSYMGKNRQAAICKWYNWNMAHLKCHCQNGQCDTMYRGYSKSHSAKKHMTFPLHTNEEKCITQIEENHVSELNRARPVQAQSHLFQTCPCPQRVKHVFDVHVSNLVVWTFALDEATTCIGCTLKLNSHLFAHCSKLA